VPRRASNSSTRLARALIEPAPARATPLDLFRLARRQWLAGRRVDVGALARQLGIGRATAFRWVGSRELLLGEVLWSLCDAVLHEAAATARGRGAVRIAAICAEVVRTILAFVPLRRFVERDPEYALRLLTSKHGPVQARAIASLRALIDTEVDRGHLTPPLAPDTLVFLIVRVVESFIYADVISGQRVDSSEAALAVELLLSGRVRRSTRRIAPVRAVRRLDRSAA
jgi:hypothetical protein